MKKPLIYLLLSTVFVNSSNYSAREAMNHIGEKATVCGIAVSTHYARSSRGRPTFINLDRAYPNQIFTIVIWGEYRRRFNHPEIAYKGRYICATGRIRSYRNKAEMIVYSPSQIRPQ